MIVVCGSSGFVGRHLVRRLLAQGQTVRCVDRTPPTLPIGAAFYRADLRDPIAVRTALRAATVVYQLAADMGGAGYLFTGDHDAEILHTSALINLNVLHEAARMGAKKIFFPSSACVYPQHRQETPDNLPLAEHEAYPADPDSDYGFEKLFAERLYLAFGRNTGIQPKIARFHAIVGPDCTWQGGREKVFAAIARKVAQAPEGGVVEVWGDGQQKRSFLDIEDCLDGIERLMASEETGPFNLGSSASISIDDLVKLFARIAGKSVRIVHRPGPQGVRGRASDNTKVTAVLDWAPTRSLEETAARVYHWVAAQVAGQGASHV